MFVKARTISSHYLILFILRGCLAVRCTLRKWFTAEGLFLIIMGITAIIVPNVFTLGIILFLGWLLIICGILQTVRVLSTSNMPSSRLWLFSGILQIIIGYFFVADPPNHLGTATPKLPTCSRDKILAASVAGNCIPNFVSAVSSSQ
jgi:uncharacterized membrane protein HdeD (DUF308 family)